MGRDADSCQNEYRDETAATRDRRASGAGTSYKLADSTTGIVPGGPRVAASSVRNAAAQR